MPDKIVKFESFDGKTFNSFRAAKIHEVEIKNFGIDLIVKLINLTPCTDSISKEKSLLWDALNQNYTKEKAWQFCYELFLLFDEIEEKRDYIFDKEASDLFKRIRDHAESKFNEDWLEKYCSSEKNPD